MLNLILLQAKESFTNDFVPVPNKEKVTPAFLFVFQENRVDANARTVTFLATSLWVQIKQKKNVLTV